MSRIRWHKNVAHQLALGMMLMMLMTMMLMATPAAGSDPSSHGLRACNLIVGLLVGVAAGFGGCGGVT
jgi:hypothetical protein